MHTKIQSSISSHSAAAPSGLRASLFVAAIVGSAAAVHAQSVVYRENFTFNNPSADTVAEMGWSVSVATSDGTLRPGDLGKAYSDSGAGMAVASAASLASSPAVPDADEGSLGVSLDWTGSVSIRRAFFSTTEVAALNLSSAELSSISYGGSDYGFQPQGWGADLFRGQVALQIGGTWYLSNTVNTATNANFTAFSVDPNAVTWSTIDPSASLATISGTASLPTGPVQAAGLLITTNGSDAYVRFDQFVLEATPIPEPSSAVALVGLAAAGLVAFRRRRRS